MKKLFITMICIFILPSLFFKDGGEILAFPTQEKAYLHTDKPFYLIGDTIWVKGYLVDAQTHKESDAQSRFLYIELINRKNKVIQRKKIKEQMPMDKYALSCPTGRKAWNLMSTFLYTRKNMYTASASSCCRIMNIQLASIRKEGIYWQEYNSRLPLKQKLRPGK